MDWINKNNLFRIESTQRFVEDFDFEILAEKIQNIADFFGISFLPYQYRIILSFYNETDMKKMMQKDGVNFPNPTYAYTAEMNKIYILDYSFLQKSLSKDSYLAIIIHEFAHIFQAIYSCVLPKTCVWLYESIACYMAGQSKTVSLPKNGDWDLFVNSFYDTPDCYGFAYELGRKLFEYYDKETILKMIKKPTEFISQFKSLFMLRTE